MQVGAELKEKVTWLIERTKDTLARKLGIEYQVMEKDRIVASMPVLPNRQPFGILHGGASLALAETLASVGAWLNVDESRYAVVGMELNGNHLRSMREGNVIGTGTPIHRGRSTQVWEVKITDEQGKLVCISRCTLAVLEKRG